MSLRTIAFRYASTLAELAVEKNQLDKVKEDIQVFQSAIDVPAFKSMLKSPVISKAKKKAIMNQVFDSKVSGMSTDFLAMLLKKNREEALPDICLAFMDIYREKNKISSIRITSAVEMDRESLDAIKNKLIESKVVYPTLEVATAIDSSLIGGFVVEFGDKILDASLSTKIAKLKRSMTSFN